MRYVLPGGARLKVSDERAVVVAPLAAVLERAVPRCVEAAPPKPLPGPHPPPHRPGERLATIKLWLEVLAVLVGLLGAILALFGLSLK